jgi:integrase
MIGLEETTMPTPERQQAIEVNTRSHLKIDEVVAILQAARDESARDWAMFTVCFRHAFRSAEVASLRWSDIDQIAGMMTVQRLKGGMRTIQPVFRAKGAPVLDEMFALKAWRKEQNPQPGNPYVFTTQKSVAHIRRETVSRLFRHYAERASTIRASRGERPIPECCWHVHSLRHSMITIMVNTKGVDVFDAKALAGHTKIESTLRYAWQDQRKACEEAERSIIESLA